jgi:hypothetical protein
MVVCVCLCVFVCVCVCVCVCVYVCVYVFLRVCFALQIYLLYLSLLYVCAVLTTTCSLRCFDYYLQLYCKTAIFGRQKADAGVVCVPFFFVLNRSIQQTET